MSYDWEGPHQLPPKRKWYQKPGQWYWGFVLWAALDSPWDWLQDWGFRRIHK